MIIQSCDNAESVIQYVCVTANCIRPGSHVGNLGLLAISVQVWTIFFPQDTTRAARDSAKRRLSAVLASDRVGLASDSPTIQRIKMEVCEVGGVAFTDIQTADAWRLARGSMS